MRFKLFWNIYEEKLNRPTNWDCSVPYQVIDGKIVLSMDAENIKVAIVREVAGISLAAVAAIVIICLAISTSYVRRRKKKKMKRLLRVG